MDQPDSANAESKRVARDERVGELTKQGFSAERIASDTGLSAVGVRKIQKELGVKKGTSPRVEDPLEKNFSTAHTKIGLRFYNFYHFDKVRTSSQLSEEIGWSVQKIASIGKGQFNLTLVDIQRMATYMNKTIAELMEGL